MGGESSLANSKDPKHVDIVHSYCSEEVPRLPVAPTALQDSPKPFAKKKNNDFIKEEENEDDSFRGGHKDSPECLNTSKPLDEENEEEMNRVLKDNLKENMIASEPDLLERENQEIYAFNERLTFKNPNTQSFEELEAFCLNEAPAKQLNSGHKM